MRMLEIWDRLVSALYPKRCVLCGEVVDYDTLWCGCPCERADFFRENDGALEGACAPLAYSGQVRQAVLAMKREKEERTLRFMAEQMALSVQSVWQRPFSCAVPVPASLSSLAERGYNQAALLAAELAGLLQIPVREEYLLRRDDAQVQHRLHAREREKNARRAFALSPNANLGGGRVLLVDDVYTTGSTLRTCAALLRAAGADAVCGVTAVYTIPEKEHSLKAMRDKARA